MMLYFGLIFAIGAALVFGAQKLDIEGVNPPKARRRPAAARKGYAAPPAGTSAVGGAR
jgi:hypothetical protein